ncbi:MAG: SUF system Fe-S cluster assembly regulator [Proteobacteria bacterium]|nr:SUF system Fe-S cluster assembly regulator [Pseudomonadota bacterium]
MIRITKQADYGTLLLTHFAREREKPTLSARELARKARLPLPTVTKILKILAREGLLVSQRGVKGGYSLARRAEEITANEIVTALDGPVAITQCCDNATGCERELGCLARPNWQRIDQALREALGGVTLSDLAKPSAQTGAGRDAPVGAAATGTSELKAVLSHEAAGAVRQ